MMQIQIGADKKSSHIKVFFLKKKVKGKYYNDDYQIYTNLQ